MKIPTPKQYERMQELSPANAAFRRSKRLTEPLIRHGWVTAQDDGEVFNWVRITPDGLRALAAAVELYGLAEFPARKSDAVISVEWTDK